MNIALWILQALLAAFFLMPGIGKLSKSKAQHVSEGHLQAHQSLVPIRILGILELAGCIGIILPWWTGICPILTPITALCFGGIMISGLLLHSRRKEYKMILMLLVVGIIAGIVAYFRFRALGI